MGTWVKLLLPTSTIDNFIVTEVDARVVWDISAAFWCQTPDARLLRTKTTECHAWIIALLLTKWIYFGLKAKVPGLVIAQMTATFGLVASDTWRHVLIAAHEAVRVVLYLTTEGVDLVRIAEVRQWTVAVTRTAAGSSSTRSGYHVIVTAQLGGGIVAAGVTLLEHMATVTEVGRRIVAVCTAALSVVAANSRNNLSNAAMLTSGVIRFVPTLPV